MTDKSFHEKNLFLFLVSLDLVTIRATNTHADTYSLDLRRAIPVHRNLQCNWGPGHLGKREIRTSGSMSGNRNQSHAKPD
jgi:hypothetical protein